MIEDFTGIGEDELTDFAKAELARIVAAVKTLAKQINELSEAALMCGLVLVELRERFGDDAEKFKAHAQAHIATEGLWPLVRTMRAARRNPDEAQLGSVGYRQLLILAGIEQPPKPTPRKHSRRVETAGHAGDHPAGDEPADSTETAPAEN